jgi:hexosaminidase
VLDNKILAWDEAVDGDLPVNETIIFWWRHNHPEQLKKAIDKGYAIVLCPRLPLYLDFVQDSTLSRGRKWDGLFNSLENVYGFSHLSIPESSNGRARIIGIQGNLWTETIPDVQRLDFMVYPRICALAEAAWTDPENRNFKFFENRLKPELELYRKAGLYFYEGKYAVKEQ